MFFDFSSAFNTIQPCLLRNKLLAMHLHPDTASWILDYLTGRQQYVRVDGCASEVMISNTSSGRDRAAPEELLLVYSSQCTVLCCGGGIRAGEASRLNKLVRKASSVVGLELDRPKSVAERMMMDKIKAILDNPSHLLYDELWQMGSSFCHQIIPPRCKTAFAPAAIRLYYSSGDHSHHTTIICWLLDWFILCCIC